MSTAETAVSAPPVRILVIEDDPATLKTLASLLRSSGYEITEASGGGAGIELAHRGRPDLIICDVTMPQIDGYDVLRALKKDPNTAVIPFIFLSGNQDHDFVRQGMGLGADDYVTKPFMPQQLFDSIQARIERQRVITRKLEQLRTSLVHAVPNEFFTPLNAILGFSMLVLDTLRTGDAINREDLQDSMESIHLAGEQLLRIASNYVLYSQLATEESLPRTSASAASVEGWEVELARSIRRLAMQRDRMKDLHYSFAPAPLAIAGAHLEKIVVELLDNAFKFSQPGEWVAVTGLLREHDYVIRVADHGRGMTPEQVQSLAPLVQFDRARFVQAGVGLGLPISQLLARKYGGTLELTRNQGAGVTVQVVLPLDREIETRAEEA